MYRNPWVSGHLRPHPTLPGNGPTQENTPFSRIRHILTTLLQAPPYLAENLTRASTSPIYDICTEVVWYLRVVPAGRPLLSGELISQTPGFQPGWTLLSLAQPHGEQ